MIISLLRISYCCDDVKDTKNESHSQRLAVYSVVRPTVVTMSKIQKMKAIHNSFQTFAIASSTVVTMSKIQKMKAIHNHIKPRKTSKQTVVTMSKIQKMKAIHNMST